MKAIRKSTKPTLIQMQKMASNLKEKFGVVTTVDISCWGSGRISFGIYVASTESSQPRFELTESWSDCFDKYSSMMKEEVVNE